MTDPIRTSRDESILTIVLDRPKANAIDAATSREMGEVFSEFRDDPELRVAVLTGAGDRFFSAGWDLEAAADGEAFDADYGPGGFGGFPELPDLDKPVICAVNGMAVGGGFEIVMAAHLVVASDHARFWLPEAGLGLVADAGSILLPRMIPAALANEVLLAGRRLDASEALTLGLVNRVVPGDQLMDAAYDLAGAVVAAAPLSVATVIEIGRRTRHLARPEAFERLRSGAIDRYQQMLESDDATEGPVAFIEGRQPRWQGR